MAGHVVVDAGPLIHLTQADALHLLDEFEIVTIPKTVPQEVEHGGVPEALSELDYRTDDTTRSDVPSLDSGEK